jgi:predicted ATPase/DNA-binding XRE family transcriptional regulator
MTGGADDFADLLRRARRNWGLTQEELAHRAGLSTRAISDLERGAKSRPHRDTVERLSTALALSPDARAAFVAASRRPSGDTQLSDDVSRSNLPIPANPLLGRTDELQAISDLLRQREVRLLTLTGIGGVGKTRLAIAVATELRSAFPDGVFLVPLAPVSDPKLVGSVIAHRLRLRETVDRVLVGSLATQRLLLVLDNFEHLLGAAGLIAELTASAPDLTVLVTSRAPLAIAAEHEYPVHPLPVPDRASGASAAHTSAAVELFVQRAGAVRPELELNSATMDAIAEICRRLDGLPLAIELSATRCRLLSPQAIVARLDHRLSLLTAGTRDAPPRHQTLRAALTWSYDLLPHDAKALFRRITVLSGGFGLDAIAAVASDATEGRDEMWGLLDLLASLVGQSLLGREDQADGEPRFSMLETVREYGSELLAAAGETAAAERAHATFYSALALEAEPELVGSRQLAWFDRLEAEHANLNAALTWAVAHDPKRALAMVGALGRFWDHHSHRQEGLRWLEKVLALGGERDPAAEAKARWGAGGLALHLSDPDRAERHLTQAVHLAEVAGDRYSAGFAHNVLGSVALHREDFAVARAHHEAGLALLREVGDIDGVAALLGNLGHGALLRGDYAEAATRSAESLALYRQLGSSHGASFMLGNLGRAVLEQGEPARAGTLLREGLALGARIGNEWYITVSLGGLAAVASVEGNHALAVRLFGAVETLATSGEVSLPASDRRFNARYLALARSALDEKTVEAAWAAGLALALEDAIAEAMAESEQSAVAPTHSDLDTLGRP